MITSTGTVITMTDKLKEAADKISNEGAQPILRSMYPTRSRNQMANEFRNFFISGAEWAREEVLEMLRSDEAEEKPKPFKWNFVIEKTYDTGKGWADWLEKRWREEGHFDELG